MSTPGLDPKLAELEIRDNVIPAFLKKLKDGTDPNVAKKELFEQISELLGALRTDIPSEF